MGVLRILEGASVAREKAARVSIIMFIQRSYRTLKGHSPIVKPDKNTTMIVTAHTVS